ncbi:MAG: hypothetical protein LBG08_00645 [Spirochaetaceae bacterium]|jgi:hypothetical protein|nr:hypothetical protein [Spirochaetaceae bacterium]
MKLWLIGAGDPTPVNTLDSDGTLDINVSSMVSVSATLNLAAGRYITEIRLKDTSDNFAYYREVTEIWSGLTTTITFGPEEADYLDPDTVLINSRADLDTTSTIDGTAISTLSPTGTGTENDPLVYSLFVKDISKVAVNFVPETGSENMFISYSMGGGIRRLQQGLGLLRQPGSSQFFRQPFR